MNAKWFFSTLIILFTLLGSVAHQEQSHIPNQEIVLQFTSDDISYDETQNAITNVKKQLHHLGINEILIGDVIDGVLTITYHSSIDIKSIKKSLLEKGMNLGNASVKNGSESLKSTSKENAQNYNLDIYEIQDDSKQNQGSAGKFVIVAKQDYDRYSNSNVVSNHNKINVSETAKLAKLALKVYGSIAIKIDQTSHSIPEVRAGPIS